ncbi:MAG: MBL fold metallo-hydrolase [Candidatus Saliniplasma sp.]
MKVEVTYLVHSCFTVELDDKVLLFDYPSRSFSRSNLNQLVKSKMKGKKAYIFASHSHGDHYSSDIFEFENTASETYFILSDDIPSYGISKSSNIYQIGSKKQITIDDLSIQTFESNDAGVAFLISYKNKKIYFGGDLAKWDWPEWSESKRREHVEVFESILDELNKLDIELAFSNMDKRLKSWAGPLDFMRAVKPGYFVPMHTFGNEPWVDDLLGKDIPKGITIFHYKKTGDSVVWDI